MVKWVVEQPFVTIAFTIKALEVLAFVTLAFKKITAFKESTIAFKEPFIARCQILNQCILHPHHYQPSSCHTKPSFYFEVKIISLIELQHFLNF